MQGYAANMHKKLLLATRNSGKNSPSWGRLVVEIPLFYQGFIIPSQVFPLSPCRTVWPMWPTRYGCRGCQAATVTVVESWVPFEKPNRVSQVIQAVIREFIPKRLKVERVMVKITIPKRSRIESPGFWSHFFVCYHIGCSSLKILNLVIFDTHFVDEFWLFYHMGLKKTRKMMPSF